MRGKLGVLACATALTCAHCSREDDRSRRLDLNPAFSRAASAALEGGAQPPSRPARMDEPWRGDVDAALPRLQMIETHTVVVDAGRAPVVVNPDDAILEQARVAAGGCFGSLPAGPGSPPERAAHIVFTVIPTGTVTSADVSSDDTGDEAVLACLRQRALATRFSDTAGGPLRTYAIDVRVIAKGNTGAR